MEFTVTWCLRLVLLRCRDMRLFLPGTLKQNYSISCWWHCSIKEYQWNCSGSSKQISRFHYRKNCLPIRTACLSPNWQHELEWLQICFCRDISQNTMAVTEYISEFHYITSLLKKKHKKRSSYYFTLLFCKRTSRKFAFKISCQERWSIVTPGFLEYQTWGQKV